MKTLKQYIQEAIKRIPRNSGIIVFDIDDTLLKANPDVIKVYKTVDGKRITLTTEQYAKDPDAGKHPKMFSFEDFHNPVKVYNSIISGTPLIKNLRIMEEYVKAGYDFCFLTARGAEETIKKAIKEFLKTNHTKKYPKALDELEDAFKETFSHAINDAYKKYPGGTDAEKKANVLKDLCKEYEKVVFVDDDKKNVRAARGLELPNLKVIQAWDD